MEHILTLKAAFDPGWTWQDHAIRCLNLGWPLVAIEVITGNNLDLDFANLNHFVKRLEEPGVDPAQINLGVHTGSRSGLLVLEVALTEERACLDKWGAWRSQCVAELGSGLEKHFYLLSPDFQPLPAKIPGYAYGAITLLPPSLDPVTQERWRWRHPPWDSAPSPLPAGLINYLNSLSRPADTAPDHRPRVSWRELYCLISASEEVLQAFTHKGPSMEGYYDKLLQAALKAGLTESDFLLSLLWFAPQGDARERPERWAYLQELVCLVRNEEPSCSRTISSVQGLPLNFQEKGVAGRQPLSRRARQKS